MIGHSHRTISDTTSTHAGVSFGRSGRRQSSTNNSTISSVTVNGKNYEVPVYDDRGNRLNWLLSRLSSFIRVLGRRIGRFLIGCLYRNSAPLHHQFSALRTISELTSFHSHDNFKHPRLSQEELNQGGRLGNDSWADTGCSGKHAYVEEFVIGRTVIATKFSPSLGRLDNLFYAHVLYAYDHHDGITSIIEYNNTIYFGEQMENSLSNPIQSEEAGFNVDIRPSQYYESKEHRVWYFLMGQLFPYSMMVFYLIYQLEGLSRLK